jgi:hypothetical protein
VKSVPNLIFYLHDFFWNFSHFLAICFELFSFGMIFNSEIADSGTHLSDAAQSRARAAAHRCHVAALRRASHARLKAAVGTARRASRQPCPCARPNNTPPHARRRRPDRLTRAAVTPTASPTAPSSCPKPLARRRHAAPPSPRR